jgi:pilus assembly protein CpaF
MENDEIVTREIYRFVETDIKQEKVIGELKKINDLINVGKLANSGLLKVYQERFV